MEVRTLDTRVDRFIVSLEKMTIPKVMRFMKTLKHFGPTIGMPYSKKIDRHLFELRIAGKQSVRIFYAYHSGVIILLHGYVKKTQKIAQKELDTARSRLLSLDMT